MEELHLTTNGDEIDEWQCSKCGAAVDERWNCCEVHEQTSSRGEVVELALEDYEISSNTQ